MTHHAVTVPAKVLHRERLFHTKIPVKKTPATKLRYAKNCSIWDGFTLHCRFS